MNIRDQETVKVYGECLDALAPIVGKYLNEPDDQEYLNLTRYTAAHNAVAAIKSLIQKTGV